MVLVYPYAEQYVPDLRLNLFIRLAVLGGAFAGEQGSPNACDCVGRESRPGHHFLCSSNFWVDRSQKARSAGARFSLRTFAANHARVTI